MACYRAALVALVLVSIACSDGPGGPPPPAERSADRLWIYATTLSLTPGDTVRMGVTAADSAVTTYVQYPGGQVGDGTIGTVRPAPVPVATPMRFTSLAPGSRHTCGIGTDGRAYCWGWNRRGQIGNGAIEAPNAAINAVVPAPAPVRAPVS